MQAKDADDQVELLRAAYEQAPGFMALTRGPEHRFVLVNREFQRITGVDPTGRTLVQALPAFVAQGIGEMLDRVLATGEPFVARNMVVQVDKDGAPQEIVVDFTSQPFARGAGGSEDVLCLGYEVTERVQAEQHALRLQDELVQVARTAAFGTMAATLAHEINQPLSAASSYLRAAKKMLAPLAVTAEAREALHLAEQQLQRAGGIVEQARRAVSAELGAREAISLATMIEDALRLISATGMLRGVRVEVSPACDAVVVCVNRVQLEQVLVNLIRNAAEAMAGQEEKLLSMDVTDEGDMAVLRVRDTGHGFDQHKDSFQVFAGTSGPMGLGLAVARTIVEAHGGRIGIEKPATGGAVVLLSLPLPDGL